MNSRYFAHLAYPYQKYIVLLLGIMLLHMFVEYLLLGYFSAVGFKELMLSWVTLNQAPDWWNHSLLWLANYSSFIAPLFASFMLICATLLLLLISSPMMCLLAGGLLFFLFISQLFVPGTWTFQLLFPAIFAVSIGIESVFQRRNSQHEKPHNALITGSWLNHLKTGPFVTYVFIIAAALYYVIVAANNAGELSVQVAWMTVLLFVSFMLLHLVLDRLRGGHREIIQPNIPSEISPAADVMCLLLGIMLLIQVFANYYFGWFTREGFIELIELFKTYTMGPIPISFLDWWIDNAGLLIPLQVILESLAAVFLLILIARGPTLLFVGFLLLGLGLVEYGVPATYPPTPTSPNNWTWHLLFAAISSLILSVYYFKNYFKQRVCKHTIVDHFITQNIFSRHPFSTQLWMAALLGFSTYVILQATNVFGKTYPTVGVYISIACALLILIRVVLMRWVKRLNV